MTWAKIKERGLFGAVLEAVKKEWDATRKYEGLEEADHDPKIHKCPSAEDKGNVTPSKNVPTGWYKKAKYRGVSRGDVDPRAEDDDAKRTNPNFSKMKTDSPTCKPESIVLALLFACRFRQPIGSVDFANALLQARPYKKEDAPLVLSQPTIGKGTERRSTGTESYGFSIFYNYVETS